MLSHRQYSHALRSKERSGTREAQCRKRVKLIKNHCLPFCANYDLSAGLFSCKYSAFKERGNGLLNEDRVARFSATSLPFPASENADVR
jgi:hypothetical protein